MTSGKWEIDGKQAGKYSSLFPSVDFPKVCFIFANLLEKSMSLENKEDTTLQFNLENHQAGDSGKS